MLQEPLNFAFWAGTLGRPKPPPQSLGAFGTVEKMGHGSYGCAAVSPRTGMGIHSHSQRSLGPKP